MASEELNITGDVTEFVKSFYNHEKHSKTFDNSRVRIWKGVQEFASTLKKGSSILECGCGNGKNLGYFNELGFKVSGFDFSKQMVNICKKKGFDSKIGDLRDIPFKDNSFDNLICIAALHHLDKEEDRIKAIKEMVRVCKPGGRILITVWAVNQTGEDKPKKFKAGHNLVKFEDTFRYYYIYDESTLINFLKTNNFKIEKTFWERGNYYFIIES